MNAVQKVLRSYEHIDPALIGNDQACARQRSRSPQQHRDEGRALEHSTSPATPQLRQMLTHQGTRASRITSSESADGSLALVIRRSLMGTPPPFVVDATTCRCVATASRQL